jgi:putative nucleotidyltransferase with HDIG domain
MRNRTNVFVLGVSATALASGLVLYSVAPEILPASSTPILILGGLAIVAELLAYVLSGSATGSIAFIPYLASVLIAPGWLALVSTTGIKAALQLSKKTPPLKGLFNVSQHALTYSIAVLVYRALGGVSLLQFEGRSLVGASATVGIAALIAFYASFAANSLLVSGVIFMSTGKSFKAAWREVYSATIGFDIIAAPLVFVFAWVYVAYGPIGAATLWVPILGLRQVHKAKLQLEQTNRELLELMVKSIEARDPYTSGHSRRVQHYSTIVARAIGLGEREIERIGQAALLHDIGKIHEKYAPILRKPDRLSPDEWTIIQEHPADGANLISTMSGLKDLVDPIRHHHENWDGTGYPDGLHGEMIPLASRVIMFGDTVDAMTSERPYRHPLSEEEVRAELLRCRGKQFDPEICDRLLASPLWRSLFTSPAVASSPSRVPVRVLSITKRDRAGAG